ncbi:dihydroorotate dehydrogenase [Candidatus Micrarchaeota archaeon]|nr:dihydroorotate dehydrogenase [Candidatus Micrarchaeota archaeon]
MVKLSVELASLKLENPTILASGIIGVTKGSLEGAVQNGAAAVTTKSISIEPRKGHETPIMVETDAGFLNAVGYTNPGIYSAIEEFSDWKSKAPLILSLVGKDETEYSVLAEKIRSAQKNFKISAVELVLSCPHTPGYGLMAGQDTPEQTAKVVRAVKSKLPVPIIVKFSPSSLGVGGLAKAAEEAGASAINMGNTIGPGMKINIDQKKPVLGFKMGGLSGPAMRPVTVRSIYDIYQSVKIPIIGTGGVSYGADAIELMMAGASAIGIGTAVWYRGQDVFRKIAKEMEEWLDSNGYSSVKEIVGLAHE